MQLSLPMLSVAVKKETKGEHRHTKKKAEENALPLLRSIVNQKTYSNANHRKLRECPIFGAVQAGDIKVRRVFPVAMAHDNEEARQKEERDIAREKSAVADICTAAERPKWLFTRGTQPQNPPPHNLRIHRFFGRCNDIQLDNV